MVRGNYVAPELGLAAFNCAVCGAYSHQVWDEVIRDTGKNFIAIRDWNFNRVDHIRMNIKIPAALHINSVSYCLHCKESSIWHGPNMIYPSEITVEPPNLDMPGDIQAIYNEARSIANLSAKSAAALLRLALEKLLVHVGAKKGNIDAMIQDLIEKGIITASGSVRKALDSLRLLGNAGVHSTGINLDEDPQAAFALFKILNFVVDKLITEEKDVEAIYAFVPEGKRESLDKRRGD
ncbi:hypothetical protein HMPREF3291_00190 [Bacillus sp. HMSC76G11]|nr:hypothetical protein HMPREF3291_00190 [Bacillus sp. HMSC76G11]